jgi:hypothetical protein
MGILLLYTNHGDRFKLSLRAQRKDVPGKLMESFVLCRSRASGIDWNEVGVKYISLCLASAARARKRFFSFHKSPTALWPFGSSLPNPLGFADSSSSSSISRSNNCKDV